MAKYFWCLFFHRRYRYRTGERTIRRVSITYEVICDKCGTQDKEMVWVL